MEGGLFTNFLEHNIIMKKQILILGLMATSYITANAQLKVVNTGQTYMGTSTPTTAARLSLDHNDGYNYYAYSYSLSSHNQSNKSFIVGIKGVATNTNYNHRTFGVQGLAGGGSNGWNYGVVGCLAYPAGDGAGIYGSTTHPTGIQLYGRYAGFFNGHVYVDSTITATTYITPSDIRLKENVQNVSEITDRGGTLDNVLGMNVIKYNYKERALSPEVADTLSAPDTSAGKQPAATHYGLSAQELQQIYPDLVYEGQDGYLGVNYVELVPILIRSIQELKAELDEVKGTDSNARMAPQTTAVLNPITKQARLYQNTPNPFTAQTEIRFSLPDDATNASICIFDMTGKLLKKLPISSDFDSVTVNGYELGEGIYLYSLVVNSQEVDTKRMILTK